MFEVGIGETVPMSKKLTSNQFMVLASIAMTLNEFSQTDITQQQITEVTPLNSRTTVIRTLNELVDFTYEGHSVLRRDKKIGVNGKEQYYYTLLPNRLFAIYGESLFDSEQCSEVEHHESLLCSPIEHHEKLLCSEVEHTNDFNYSNHLKEFNNFIITEEDSNMTEIKNTEIIHVFCDSFLKKYAVEYKRSYKMDNKFTTAFKKLVTDLNSEEIKRVVEIIVENYESWSNNTHKYPLNIRTLSLAWVVDKAKGILKDEKKESSQIEKENVVSSRRNESSLSSIMKRYGGK